ncbi:hypothetical protein Q0F99_11480 [Rathayibacter oskolensis]|uniref:hypothetical protein n=1 Tax=Rathayibacter oskolensis TaxID=1891671 RepID=UPI00265F028E|nr:hypothetical protein [Rathayibacter oskolensis]WKK70486.1 hypothetical protein Q0F99_11480 [Rathayibacter oskolensis]
MQMFNSTRPDGLDGWTIALEQYELLVTSILGAIDAFADADGTVPSKLLVEAGQRALGDHPAFPGGRLGNDIHFTEVDLEARGVVERIPPSPTGPRALGGPPRPDQAGGLG